MFGEVRSFLKLQGKALEQIEYWRDYKGEMVNIRDHSIERKDASRSSFGQTTFIIRGEIDDVKSFPPGFLLKDVEEVIQVSDFELLFTAGTTASEDIRGEAKCEHVLRTIDEKFVSFDSIDQVEMGSKVDSAEEPYRGDDLD